MSVQFRAALVACVFTASCASKENGRCDFKMERLGAGNTWSALNDFRIEGLSASECGQKCMEREIETCTADASLSFFRSNCDLTISRNNYIKNVSYPLGISSGQKPCSLVLGR